MITQGRKIRTTTIRRRLFSSNEQLVVKSGGFMRRILAFCYFTEMVPRSLTLLALGFYVMLVRYARL